MTTSHTIPLAAWLAQSTIEVELPFSILDSLDDLETRALKHIFNDNPVVLHRLAYKSTARKACEVKVGRTCVAHINMEVLMHMGLEHRQALSNLMAWVASRMHLNPSHDVKLAMHLLSKRDDKVRMSMNPLEELTPLAFSPIVVEAMAIVARSFITAKAKIVHLEQRHLFGDNTPFKACADDVSTTALKV